ncbi:MAG TPA: phage tail sheath subtilisin-like domain-containing protein [Dehalococcoidia bacterium]|nr:phage tail sheath subtilisin-like domain-containing protein [Dehalococcoidia bacterium]
MPTTYQAPGVYVEEVPSGSRPIEGVGTAVAAFVGFTEKGPTNTPVRVTNWTQYQNTFGGFIRNGYTPLAVYGFFANGGGNAWVIRVGGEVVSQPAAVALPGRAATAIESLRVTSLLPGAEGNDITIEVADVEAAPAPEGGESGGEAEGGRFRLTISAPGRMPEVFDSLSLRRGDPRNAVDVVNNPETGSKFIRLEDLAPRGVSLAERRPAPQTYQLSGGSESMTALVPADFQGDVASRSGIEGLEALDDVTMVVTPDIMKAYQDGLLDMEGVIGLQKAILAHCARMEDRVAILDCPPGMSPQEVDDWKMKVANLVSDGGYGALYYPWIKVDDPASRQTIFMPPSGHIAGLWSRTDDRRGVHKAPANEELLGVIDLETHLTQTELGNLNVHSINCIRSFPGRGIRVWGARTLAEAASEWRYINVRRLFNFIKESIDQGTQWVVFEPNDDSLWARVRRDISAFLTRVWGTGALFGVTADEAFYVKCDRETNPPEIIDAGMMVCEIGIAPVKPAEFVIFHIRQITPGAAE